MANTKSIEWVLRVAVFGVFLGHGMVVLGAPPNWLPFLTTVGFSSSTGLWLMPLIGALDIAVAALALIYPMRCVLVWATIWAFSTALIRPLSGWTIWAFVERSANWGAPLALLLLRGIPRNWRDWFK